MDDLIARPKLRWGDAFRALRRLIANGDDTMQVFVIMNALNADETRGYRRLLQTVGGGRQAYRRVELAELLSDPRFVESFAPGTVGAAYRSFLASSGYSAAGLAEVSAIEAHTAPYEHPHEWFGRRTRDVHDIWHILTDYGVDETLGEAALVAFSFAQTRGLGWGLIALGITVQNVLTTHRISFAKAVWEGFRRGQRADWLLGKDYERLLHEPLEVARKRLNLAPPIAYQRAQRILTLEHLNFESSSARLRTY